MNTKNLSTSTVVESTTITSNLFSYSRPFFVGNPKHGGRCKSCYEFCNGHSKICFDLSVLNMSKTLHAIGKIEAQKICNIMPEFLKRKKLLVQNGF